MPSPVTRTATGTPASPAFTGSSDDGRQAGIALPWTFTFDGVGYTEVVMCTNGWVSFGADQGTNDLTPGNAFTTTTVNRAVRAWHGDGNANFGTTTPNGAGTMQWGADGTGDRFVLQWNNSSGSGSGSSSTANSINYQVVLDGPSSANAGRIQIIYGATTGTITTSRSIAIEDAVGGTGRYINALNGLSNSTTTAAAWPGNGNGYQFDPPVPCAGEPDPGAITSPVGVCVGSTASLTATGLTAAPGITYQWEESPDGTDDWDDVIGGSGATTASYTTTAINGTRYFRIKTTCTNTSDENFSNVVTVNAISPSYATYDGTLYAQGFESWSNLCNTTDVPSANWKNDPATGNNSWRRNDQGTSAAWTSTSGAYSPVFTQGSYSARFHSFNASSGTKGNLDLYIDMTAGSGNDDLFFSYINTSGGDSLTILQSTDGGATFTRLGTILTTAGAWTLVERKVTSTSATTVIRLRATSDFGGTDIGVDNFRIMPPPTCLVPTGLTLVPTMTSLSASWTAEPNADGYDWEVRDAGNNVVESNSTAGTSFSTSVALTPNTTYSVYLRSDCSGDGTSTWVGPVSVYTGYCVPTRTNSGDYISSFSTTDGITNISNAGSANAAYSDHTNMSVTASANTTFNYSVAYVGGSNGVRVWVDWDNNLQFDAGELMSTAANGASPRTGSVTVPNGTPSGSYRMRVRAAWNTVPSSACGNESYGEAEDYTLVVAPPPSCEAPTGVGASNITTEGADIAWTCTSCTGEFIVEYGAPGFTPGTDGSAGDGTIWTGSPVAGSPVTLTGLSSATAYQVYVREVCPGDDYSANSAVVNFTTACDAVDVPYSENFNSVSAPAFPNCWTVENLNGSNTWITTALPMSFSSPAARYPWNGSNPANDWMFTPGINLEGGTSYTLTYDYSASGYDEALEVYYGSAANAAGMTELIIDHGSFDDGPFTVSYQITPASSGVYYFGWHAYSDADQFMLEVDNISLIETPSCPIPTGVSVSGTTHNSTNVNFTCSGCTGSIIVEYGETGFTPGTDENPGVGGTVITGATSPQAISGLSASTAYQVYVRQDCSANGDGFSDNTAVVAFTTQAPPPECPGSLGANSVTIGSLPYSTTGQSTCGSGNNVTAANVIVACGSTSYYGAEDRTYTFTAPVTGVYNILLTTGTDQDAGIMLYQGCPFTSGSTCVGNAQSTTGLTRTLTPTLTMGETYYLVVDNFPSPACITTYSLAIDPPAACPAPTGVAVSGTTYNSTNVSFTCAGCTGTYEIDYGPNPHTAGTGTIVSGITASPYLLSPPLTQSTGYQIFVRQDCSGDDNGFSNWSSAVNFSTPAQPPVNDLCANATPVACNSVTAGTTVNASTTGAPGTCNTVTLNTAGGVWYTVQGWGGPMVASVCDGSYDTKMGVFTGSCGSFTCVTANDDDTGTGGASVCGGGTRSSLQWNSVNGTTYYIYVTGYLSNTGTFSLTVRCGDNNPSCTANGLNLEFQTDANPGQVTWEVLNAGNLVVLSGANPVP
ncbi:MAG: hypothetical protein KF797_06845, partial [Flavobacteriales bacterium]|nr:hypothetical protein [Flavobacteriales bacterium]